jgi:DNA polymerase-3 subunit delta'
MNGIGKFQIANCFAKMILCEKHNSCDLCRSCRLFNSGNHPDIYYLVPSKTKKISINDVREKINTVVKPYISHKKIFIIRDQITEEAQNALLKTLESSAEYIIFIIITDDLKNLLTTISSRCIKIKFNSLCIKEIESYLVKYKNIDKAQSKIYSKYSGGRLGVALDLTQNKYFFIIRNKVINLLLDFMKDDPYNFIKIFTLVNDINNYKDMLDIILYAMYSWYYDVNVYWNFYNDQYTLENKLINYDKLIEFNKTHAILFTINDKLDMIGRVKQKLKYNVNLKLCLSRMLIDLYKSE